MNRRRFFLQIRMLAVLVACSCVTLTQVAGEESGGSGTLPAVLVNDLVHGYCLDCHSSFDPAAELDLDTISSAPIAQNPALWEKVVKKLRYRQMPPSDMPRPDEETYVSALAALEQSLNQSFQEHPNPGRTDTFRRLTRTEYQNAIRDLLALDVDVTTLLPADESSHGFDNVTVTDLSPTLLSRYVSAAQKISRLAVGTPGRGPEAETFRLPADRTQEQHVEGLPIGTRGGVLIPYTFPVSGKYEIDVRLMRDRNEEIEGLREPHELEVLLDGARMATFTVAPPPNGESDKSVDANLNTRIIVTAGPHDLGVTFVKKPFSLLETKRQPLNVHYNFYRHPRIGPAVFQVSITGPFDKMVSDGDETPSRRRIFVARPASNTSEAEDDCAESILRNLLRRAYRRPIADDDLVVPMEFFRESRADKGFDAGIERALSAVLVNPQFLFRIERDPPGALAGNPYRVSDIELASRLSFFLWSSIPDEELLELAERGELSQPVVLEQQVRRMLDDERSASLVTNFADQWLYLRNVESITPDGRLFPDFGENLRQAFRQETELLFESVLREDLSVLELIRADYTFLNERLAKHYEVPHVYGSRFRRVPLPSDSHRGGLLRHGSVLTVTSYATRTSPVIRGKWVLENVIGLPPPPPPANVPDLEDNTVGTNLSVRERLATHRANTACASCHNTIDPVGFALENFDAVGRWREMESGKPVDAAGALPDGSEFAGVSGLENALLEHPEWFVHTMAEKMLTFALGRGVEYFDAPAVRKILHSARENQYRFSSLAVAIANSVPFQMRMKE